MKINKSIQFAKTFLETLIKGLTNIQAPYTEKIVTKDPFTFKKLIKLRGKIFESKQNNLNKQNLWTASLLAFFGSFRMGEILANNARTFDKNSTLLWSDISKNKNSWTIHIKSPKNR